MDRIAMLERDEYEYRPPQRTEYEFEKKHERVLVHRQVESTAS